MKPEAAFEKEFTTYCRMLGCEYVKIPDAIMTRAKLNMIVQKGRSDEHQRPFDGIMITPTDTICIEMKYGHNKLSAHQADWQERINKVRSGSFLQLVKREGKFSCAYMAILDGVTLFIYPDCKELVKAIISRYQYQKNFIDNTKHETTTA